MASPSEGDVETAAAALIQAGEEISNQAEEEEVADIDGRVGRKRAAAAAGVVSLPNFPAKRYCWRKPAQRKFIRSTKTWIVTKPA